MCSIGLELLTMGSVGLIFDIIGAVVLAINVPEQAMVYIKNGEVTIDESPDAIRRFHRRREKFQCGLTLLIVGFALQLLGTLKSVSG